MPKEYRPVPGAGGQELAIRAEGQTIDIHGVAMEKADQVQGFRIPQLDSQPGPHCQVSSIRGENHIAGDSSQPQGGIAPSGREIFASSARPRQKINTKPNAVQANPCKILVVTWITPFFPSFYPKYYIKQHV